MKKFLLSSVVLSCALSAYGMEKEDKEKEDIVLVNQSTAIQEIEILPISQEEEKFIPIGKNFRMNERTGKFEDAPKSSYLIFKFRSVIRDIDTAFGSEKEILNKDLRTIDLKLKEMQEGSIEYIGTKTYHLKILKDLKKMKKREKSFSKKSHCFRKS